MKLELVIGILCITIIVITALALGYDGAMAGSAFALIGALLGWQGKKQLDKKKGNVEATTTTLKKAGFTEDMILSILETLKRRPK